MKTEFFTVGMGAEYAQMALEMIPRFKRYNGISVTPITRSECKRYNVHNRAYWIKAFLWDFAAPGTERIGWVDCDFLPVAPMEPFSEAPFAARRDIPWTEKNERTFHPPLFSYIITYFNNAFFTTTRDSIPMFERLQQEVDNPVHGGCIEQTWMNKYVDEMLELDELPRSVGYLVDGEDEPLHTRNRHYTCANKFERYMGDLHLSPL